MLPERLRTRFSIPDVTPPGRVSRWATAWFVLLLLGVIAEVVFSDWPIGVGSLIASLVVVALVFRPAASVEQTFGVLVGVTLVLAVVTAVRDTDPEFAYSAAFVTLQILYHVGRWGRVRLIAIAMLLGGLLIPILDYWADPDEIAASVWIYLLADGGFNLLLIVGGLLVRSNAATRAEAVRADTAEQQRRFANDIHDSVAHHMSAIAMRAEAARRFAGTTEVDEALSDIKVSAAAGLTDLRQLLVTMRSDEPSSRPLPRLGDLHALAAEPGPAPIAVEIDPDLQHVPPAISAVIHAIAREAVTNVRRHAVNASAAAIRVHRVGDQVMLKVSDDGKGQRQDHSPGNGIQSMTDRAESVGGSLIAEPLVTGGWQVTAALPVSGQVQ